MNPWDDATPHSPGTALRSHGLMLHVSPPDHLPHPAPTTNAAVQSLLAIRRQSWKNSSLNKTVFRKAVATGATTTVKTFFGTQMTSFVGINAGLNLSTPVLAGFGLNAGLFSLVTGGLLLSSGVGLVLGAAIGGIYKFNDWKKQEEFNDSLFQMMLKQAESEVLRK